MGAPETPKEEEQDNEMTLEEYEKAVEAKKLEFKSKYAKSGGRKTVEADYANLAKVEKADINEEDAYSGLEKTKANKAVSDKNVKTKETVETNFHIPRDDGYSPPRVRVTVAKAVIAKGMVDAVNAVERARLLSVLQILKLFPPFQELRQSKQDLYKDGHVFCCSFGGLK